MCKISNSILISILLQTSLLAVEVTYKKTDKPEINQYLLQGSKILQENFSKANSLLAIPKEKSPKTLALETITNSGGISSTRGTTIRLGENWVASNLDDYGVVIYELAGVLLSHADANTLPFWIRTGLSDYARNSLGFKHKWSFSKSGGKYTDGWGKTAEFFEYLSNNKKTEFKSFIKICTNGNYSDKVVETIFGCSWKTLWEHYQTDVFGALRDSSVKYHVEYDISESPDLKEFAKKAAKLCEKYYPTISKQLWHPENYQPVNKLTLYFKEKMHYPGLCPAPTVIILSSDWFRKNPEDFGAIIHELTHCAQEYAQYIPWVTEGMTDYMRYKLGYRPKGAEPAPGGHYKDAYTRSANFLFWIEKNINKDIYRLLDKAHVLGTYKDENFKEWTGKTVDQLWKSYQESFYPKNIKVLKKDIPENNEIIKFTNESVKLIKQYYQEIAATLSTPIDKQPTEIIISYRKGVGICSIENNELVFDPEWVKKNHTETGVTLYELAYILSDFPEDSKNWFTQTVPEFIRRKYEPANNNCPFIGGNYLAGGKTAIPFINWLNKTYPGFLYEAMNHCRHKNDIEEIFRRKTKMSSNKAWLKYLKKSGYDRNNLKVHINYEQAPDLKPLAEELKQKSKKWYDKLINELDSENFTPISDVYIVFSTATDLAAADGNKIDLNVNWFRKHPTDIGCVVHELTHIVQCIPNYHPYWFIEGTADYMRYKYDLRPDHAKPRSGGSYHHGYTTAANFIEYIVQNYDQNFIKKVNAISRDGNFKEEFIKELTNKTTDELWKEYQQTFK